MHFDLASLTETTSSPSVSEGSVAINELVAQSAEVTAQNFSLPHVICLQWHSVTCTP